MLLCFLKRMRWQKKQRMVKSILVQGSKVVWKHPLPHIKENCFEAHLGCKIIHVGEQRGKLFCWGIHDLSKPTIEKSLYVAGTGQVLPTMYEGNHVGSCVMPATSLVWHVFESKEDGS